MVSYTLAGVFAYHFLNYKELFETPPFSSFMKPTDSLTVAAGPSLQLIRGFIFSVALWPFRDIFLNTKYGWLKLWGLLIGLSILSTTAASPGSVEGFIYTTIPFKLQAIGYFEVVPQTLLFSFGVYYWYKRPKKVWFIISVILVSIILLLFILAMVFPKP